MNSIQIEVIKLKRNGMQIGGKGIENMVVNMVLEKKLKEHTIPKRDNSMLLHLGIDI